MEVPECIRRMNNKSTKENKTNKEML